MQCHDCGTTTGRIIRSKRFQANLCNKCYLIWSAADGKPIEYPLPPFATIHYNEQGNPICHICGRAYKKILQHVCQKHDMTEKEYKIKFGLDRTRGIICSSTKLKLQTSVRNNYDLVVRKNLHESGKGTRFYKGSEGRTIDKCSPQTIDRLKNYHWNGKFKKKD